MAADLNASDETTATTRTIRVTIRTIRVTVAERDAEIVTDRMWQWGVRAVGQVDAVDGLVEIFTSVGDDPDAIDRATATLDAGWAWQVDEVDASVSETWRHFVTPTWYRPDMVTVPASIAPIDDDAALVTIIDPGSAFGLGDHPTTRTSMAMLAEHIADAVSRRHPVRSVLDVGCGTGALAVLAAQLGIDMIRAIDVADAAVEATRHNAELNGVGGRVDVDMTPVADLDGHYDAITANILAPVLVSMAPDLGRLLAPEGSLIISGILADRHDHVLGALAQLRSVETVTMNGWATIRLTR